MRGAFMRAMPHSARITHAQVNGADGRVPEKDGLP